MDIHFPSKICDPFSFRNDLKGEWKYFLIESNTISNIRSLKKFQLIIIYSPSSFLKFLKTTVLKSITFILDDFLFSFHLKITFNF